jgi:hypothetical protein
MKPLRASDLLSTFTAAGMVLSLTPENGLKVTPAKALTNELRETIKANKAMLVDYLQRMAANDSVAEPPMDPDRWCWPHSAAMNGQEIDTFTARLARFTDKGASLEEAERLTDKLVIRDREHDDRRLCLECEHLHFSGGHRCGNSRQSGIAAYLQNPPLLGDLAQRLQRCEGFKKDAI